MKKILLLILLMFFSIGFVQATDWDSAAALNRVNTIGKKILTANNVNYAIEFKVSDVADVNAYANINKEIYVYRGLLEYVDNDEELAGVISHEMGHIINGHCAKQGVLDAGISTLASKVNLNSTVSSVGQSLISTKISRSDEFEADLTGVDLMAKANYNPLAMVSLLNKISGNYFDVLSTHPSGEKRILNVYNYIDYNYNSYIGKGYKTESYTKALTMIQPTVNKRKASEKLTKKYEKEQKKLLAKKQKRSKKMQGTNSIWDGYYSALTLMAS